MHRSSARGHRYLAAEVDAETSDRVCSRKKDTRICTVYLIRMQSSHSRELNAQIPRCSIRRAHRGIDRTCERCQPCAPLGWLRIAHAHTRMREMFSYAKMVRRIDFDQRNAHRGVQEWVSELYTTRSVSSHHQPPKS
jgi:hypothetical protein